MHFLKNRLHSKLKKVLFHKVPLSLGWVIFSNCVSLILTVLLYS